MAEKRMTTEETIKWVKENSKCEIVGVTKTERGKKAYIFRCGCGEEFVRIFANFKKGNMACKKCSDVMTRQSKSFTYEYVKSYVESKGCELISKEYINCDSKIWLECGRCGKKFETTFYHFKNKNMTQCKWCSFIDSGEKQAFTYDYVYNYIKDFGCELLSKKYTNAQQKLKIKCGCGRVFENTIYEFKMKNIKQCPKCGAKLRRPDLKLSYNDMKEYIESVGLELINKDFTDIREDIKVMCICGNTYITTFAAIKYGNKVRCDECTEKSHMERITREFLKVNDIEYEKEKTFDDCINLKTGKRLRYDYYLPAYNLLLELDGEQHFRPVRFYKVSDEELYVLFEQQQVRDKIKNEYALDNNIWLIRIPYWDMLNIEKILIEELNLENAERMIKNEIRKTS